MVSDPGEVYLERTEENLAEIDALASTLGGRVGLRAVLADLNRRASRTLAPGWAVHRAYTWDAADRRDQRWWPQGISTSADASGIEGGEAVEGRRLVVVSWYAKDGQGSRVTVLDLDSRRYRHVLLVEPVQRAGRVVLKPLVAHVGGLVWHGPYLHLAATARGMHTCHIDDLLRVPNAGLVETFGYRYVLPVRFSYRAGAATGLERLRYSFLSIDRGATPPELVAGEYGSRTRTRRLARFSIDPTTGLLAVGEDGASRPLALDEDGVTRAQGAALAAGRWYVTASTGPWVPGSVYVGRPGAFRRYRWATPMGPEDLTWWPSTDLLWSVTEHPRRRWVYAMKRSRFAGAREVRR